MSLLLAWVVFPLVLAALSLGCGLLVERLGPAAYPPGPWCAAGFTGCRQTGASLPAIAAALNEEGVATAHGGARWYPSSVRAVLISTRAPSTRAPSE